MLSLLTVPLPSTVRAAFLCHLGGSHTLLSGVQVFSLFRLQAVLDTWRSDQVSPLLQTLQGAAPTAPRVTSTLLLVVLERPRLV